MNIKAEFSRAFLTVVLAAALGGVCFAQSLPANAAGRDSADLAHPASDDVVVAAALPNSMDLENVRTDAAEADDVESAASEPAAPATREAGRSGISRIGIGVKVSTLGAGVEVATPLGDKFNVRGGFNFFRYSRPIADSGIQYEGQLQFQSGEAHLDWFPLGGFLGGLHVSPGLLLYNGNQISATAAVAGGQTFSVGGTTYESDPITPVTGAGKLSFTKVSPTVMIGVGNLIPRSGRHFSFLFEVGAAYTGTPSVALNLAGNVCDPTTGLNCRAISSDPTVQANVQAQQTKIQNELYRFYPILSLGVGFNF